MAPGVEGGNAIADLLWAMRRRRQASVSWPRSAGQCPIYYAHNLTHQPIHRPCLRRGTGYSQLSAVSFRLWVELYDFAYSNVRLDRAEAGAGYAQRFR